MQRAAEAQRTSWERGYIKVKLEVDRGRKVSSGVPEGYIAFPGHGAAPMARMTGADACRALSAASGSTMEEEPISPLAGRLLGAYSTGAILLPMPLSTVPALRLHQRCIALSCAKHQPILHPGLAPASRPIATLSGLVRRSFPRVLPFRASVPWRAQESRHFGFCTPHRTSSWATARAYFSLISPPRCDH